MSGKVLQGVEKPPAQAAEVLAPLPSLATQTCADERVAMAIAAVASRPHQALDLAEHALVAPDLTPGLRLDALRAAGLVHVNLGQLSQALRYLTAAGEEARHLGDLRREARAQGDLGVVRVKQGRLEDALHAFVAAITLAGPSSDVATSAYVNMGLIAEQLGEYHLYLELEQAVLDHYPPSRAHIAAAINCAMALCKLGRFEEARVRLQDVLKQIPSGVINRAHLESSATLCWIDAKCGHLDAASAALGQIVDEARRSGLATSELKACLLQGELQAMAGQHGLAAAAVEAHTDKLHLLGHTERADLASWLSKSYAALGRWEDAYQALCRVQSQPCATALMHEYFLQARDLIGAHHVATAATGSERVQTAQVTNATAQRLGFSASDAVILEALAGGCSNKQIALAIGLSVHTVRNRLAKLMRKLNVNTRAAAVTRAVALGIVVVAASTKLQSKRIHTSP